MRTTLVRAASTFLCPPNPFVARAPGKRHWRGQTALAGLNAPIKKHEEDQDQRLDSLSGIRRSKHLKLVADKGPERALTKLYRIRNQLEENGNNLHHRRFHRRGPRKHGSGVHQSTSGPFTSGTLNHFKSQDVENKGLDESTSAAGASTSGGKVTSQRVSGMAISSSSVQREPSGNPARSIYSWRAGRTQIQGQGRGERFHSTLTLSIEMTRKWGFERHAGFMRTKRKYLHFTPRTREAAG